MDDAPNRVLVRYALIVVIAGTILSSLRHTLRDEVRDAPAAEEAPAAATDNVVGAD